MIGFIPFPGVLGLCEMQSISSRIWTRVTVSISYDDNHYTTGTSSVLYMTLNNLALKIWNVEYPLHFHCSQAHSDPKWYHLIVLSMGQIERTVSNLITDVELWLLYSNTWNHLTELKKKSSGSFKKLSPKCVYKSYIYSILMYKEDLRLNNLQWLMCHKTQPNQIKQRIIK